MHRLADVLNGLLALIDELKIELVANLVAHPGRTGDATWSGQTFQPRCHVDAIAVEIFAVNDDVAHIDADAEFDVPIIRNPGITILHTSLDFDGTACRIEDAAKLHQKAVPHRLEDATSMLSHTRVEELAAMMTERA